MKKAVIYLWVLCSLSVLFSCVDDYDDSFLRTEIDKIKEEINTLKTQLSSLETVVDLLNKGKVITSVEEISDNDGHKITFNDGSSIVILNGENAPVIGIQESDGVYYWTITTNGITDFLLDQQVNRIPVTGNNGQDGVTPQLAIDADGYWTINGVRLTDANNKEVKAEGDSFFQGIEESDESVTFILADGNTIEIAKSMGTYLKFKDVSAVFNAGQTKRLTFGYANLHSLAIISQPDGWTINIHAPQKYLNVTAASEGYGSKDIKLQGIDQNGLTYLATIKVSIAGTGYTSAEGVFVLNEGNMTTENGSLVYIAPNGEIFNRVYNNANGAALGNVSQDLFIDGYKMYIISQNGKTNPMGLGFENDGMLIVTNSETLQKIASYTDELTSLSWPSHVAVLDEDHIFLRDNNGVHRFNSNTTELTLIANTRGAAKNRMAVVNDKLFFYAGRNLSVIEKNSDVVSATIDMGANISGIEKSRDGNLWVATTGTPQKISKINSSDYSVVKTNDITLGSVASGMFATPGITTKGDTIYYGGGSLNIYRHIFTTGECKEMINKTELQTLVPDARMVYNSMAVHPVTGRVYLNTIKGYGWDFTVNNISVFDFDDAVAASALHANYRNYTSFPTGIFFPYNFR
jgi:hypothetical protein